MASFLPLRKHRSRLIMAALVGCLMINLHPAPAQSTISSLPSFDFRQADALAGWGELHDISRLEPAPGGQGMAIHIKGPDPYFSGPPRDYPSGVPLLMKIRLEPSTGGSVQVFYFGPDQGAAEDRSVRFSVKRGGWQEHTLPIPPLGPGFRLRIDPPGDRGVCRIASIRFEPRLTINAPNWTRPTVPEPTSLAPAIHSGELTFHQHPSQLGGFTISLRDQLLATGHNRPMIGYVNTSTNERPSTTPSVRWLDVAKLATVKTRLDPAAEALTVLAEFRDPDGGRWRLRQTIKPGPAGGFTLIADCEVDAPRSVVFLPLVLVLPGHGSHGVLKTQGLFAGIEYLDNEPSSSTADLTTLAGADRRVPDSARITFPLMAIAAAGNYVGLIWDQAPGVAALFDSPDRVFGTEGHLLGLLAPGANGTNRINGELFPLEPLALRPGQPTLGLGDDHRRQGDQRTPRRRTVRRHERAP